MTAAREILVIDDEPVVLQSVERVCGCEAIAVDTASSGRLGLERLGQHTYGLILCDMIMEDLDGVEFLAEVARRGIRTPVVMTTGCSTGENAIRALQSGAIDFLPKPFTPDELMAVVRRALSYGVLQDERRVDSTPGSRPDDPAIHRLGEVSWAETKPEGTVLIGVNDLFVRTMNGIRNVELLPVGTSLMQGKGCATIISTDGLTHEIICPVSGQIIEVHHEVASNLSTLETDPYGTGWLYRILPSDSGYSLSCLGTQGATPAATIFHPERGIP
jgi:CheY-like chemotaxis protein/glycine cleavage system H lipoate-binding protein